MKSIIELLLAGTDYRSLRTDSEDVIAMVEPVGRAVCVG